ncbi:transporter [Flammeovirga sp. SJP92]|uniref:transporter n=1 Tax=Flammeovirga sp. SJP92 TaxID=1775430 RepID=UPI0007892B83|nr:hypothetical protein [Flammeovirga sp. SJP92]KXX68627.1 hypothetical protein AVL50_22990 [Flammeovirga sp. SJP92]
MKKLALFFITCLTCLSVFAQHPEEAGHDKKQFISITIAQTFIPKGANMDNLNHKGHFVPGIGFDYLYRVKPKLEVGVMLDFELGRYIIPHKDDLVRDHAFVVAGVLAYSITPHWNVFGGGGIELEKHHNLGVFRLGTEYNFEIGKHWSIPVGLFYDIKEGYDTFSLSVGIGKAF